MEWQLPLLVILMSLLVMMASGMPIAFCFMLVNIAGMLFFFGGEIGLRQLILSISESVTTFTLLPLPLFVLMGEVIFHSGIAPSMIDALDKWIGRLTGRLSLLAVGAGTLLAALAGNSMASVAMLGSTLVPEMQKRDYKKPMTLGPILGSGGLAIMIPPSGLAVFVGAVGVISIGGILTAIIIPGLIMAALYATYIIVRCWLQPHLAPSYYEETLTPLSEKITRTAKYVLPVGFIVFLVVGVIFLGVATPSEAAATGALGCFILTAVYGRLNWETLRKAMSGTMQITGMILLIIVGAKAFSQILARSGASSGLVEFTLGLPLSPILIIIAMQIVVLILGAFVDQGAIIMITLPLFMPVIHALGFDSVWFAVIFLLNMEMAATTPPFGLCLFTMKGVAPLDTTMGDIYRAALPFLGCDLLAMAFIIAIPEIAMWLPGVMR